ncbi:hypothetical protein IW261DRAFT_1562462 [Armillaria novae-zelandiae]|uniref:Uncharacterized protein n=1 Tax=Armillaria novae-zelandiae TaxID=153914 RepID=A0AA39PEI0_9AGAR|nr:hypothetical protein IW261DRAFT_1562462 [Armillaria novae-zelandiae]
MEQPHDPQLRLLVSLNIMPQRPRSTTEKSLPTHKHLVGEESNKTILFLNWISRCFVCDTDTYSDNVSVAASFTGNSCTLYIATSRGMANQADYDYSKQFLAVCRDVFLSQDRVLAAGKEVLQEDAGESVRKILDCILDRVWTRFLRKVAALKREFLAEGGFERLDGLLQAWITWRAEKGKPGERSRDVITIAEHETGGDTHAMLRGVFDVILNEDSPTQSREERFEYFVRVTTRCIGLFYSNFFRDGCRRRFPEAEMSFFFCRTVRRLWRVQIYHSGAVTFATTWMKHCRAIFNVKEPSFSGVWVGHTMPKVVDFPVSIRETLLDILHRRQVNFSDKDLDRYLEGKYMRVDSTCREGQPLTLHPHPEIQMLHYLHWSGISVFKNAVGSSKPVCEVCMRYKMLYEERSNCPENLVFTPRFPGVEKEHFERDWMLPDSSSGNQVQRNVVDTVLNSVVSEFTIGAENRFAWCFLDARHPDLLDPASYFPLY